MSRPSVRRALRRAGAERRRVRPAASAPRNLGRIPPPKIFLPGEAEDAGPVDFSALFGRVAPVEMEIGVGKGRFLLAAAAAHPGTELVRPRDRARVRPDRAPQGRARGPPQPARRTARRKGVRREAPLPGLPRGPPRLLPGSLAEEAAPQAPPRGRRVGLGGRARPRPGGLPPARRVRPRGVLRV